MLWTTGKVKKLDKQIIKRAFRKLEYIDLASNILDLKVPPSNKLEDFIEEMEITQYRLAKDTCIPHATVTKLMQGKNYCKYCPKT